MATPHHWGRYPASKKTRYVVRFDGIVGWNAVVAIHHWLGTGDAAAVAEGSDAADESTSLKNSYHHHHYCHPGREDSVHPSLDWSLFLMEYPAAVVATAVAGCLCWTPFTTQPLDSENP